MKTEQSSKKYSVDDCKKPWHHTALHHAKHWFIPHEGNNHQPHALRPKALKAYAYILISAKIASAVLLFVAFPNQAQYAAFTANTIVSLTNQSRAENKLGALTTNSKLAQAALNKAKDMFARDYFAHTTPDGKRFWTWIDSTGYDYILAGENLAIDFTTPESAHSALMASPTHRENILNNRYKEIGVAVLTGKMDGEETTLLVEMFGTQAPKKTKVAKVTTVKPKTSTPVKTTPVKKPATSTKVQSGTTPEATGTFTQQSLDKFTLLPKASINVWAEFKNTGESTWKAGSILLTTDPAKRNSNFSDNGWTSQSVVDSNDKDVPSNDILRFEWTFTAKDQAASNVEKFNLTTADGKVLAKTSIAFDITISTPTALAQTQTPTQSDIGTPATPEQPGTPQVINSSITNHAPNDILTKILGFVNNFYLAFLIFIGIALAINVFIKVRIQHAHVIGQSLAVIALAAGFLIFKFHFLQQIESAVKVLGQIVGS